MGMKTSFSIRGLDELSQLIEEKVTMDDVRNVIKLNGSEMQQQAMRNAAVDTGAMKRYIMISIHGNGMEVRVKPLMEYSQYVEYGTRFMAAQPFMKPAYKEQKIKFKKDLKRLTR